MQAGFPTAEKVMKAVGLAGATLGTILAFTNSLQLQARLFTAKAL
jgi:hypothetical protein